jgi:hypothetical protein
MALSISNPSSDIVLSYDLINEEGVFPLEVVRRELLGMFAGVLDEAHDDGFDKGKDL